MKAFTRIFDDLADGAKVFAFAEAAGISRAAALGCMVRWLTWVDANCTTHVTGLRAECVSELVFGVRGVWDGLVAIGWVDMDEKGYVVVCDYDKYLSPTSKARAAEAERKARLRCRKAVAVCDGEGVAK